jgi:mannan endo-1,4-beta-mannosidase
MMKTQASVLAAAIVLAALRSAPAIEPADKELIPEARAVLNYLESVYGKKTIAALNGLSNVSGVQEASGKEPAIVGFDLSGWNSPPWGKSYKDVVQRSIDSAKSWAARGGIVTMQCHWIHPSNPDGSAWLGPHGRKTPSPPFDFAAALKPGTKANQELLRDLKGHADYLEQLADARVPVLWRPLHEIEGGWFWWTDQEQPENTAALWRYMFDYFTKERKLHNLIWVYASALRCGKGKEGVTNVPMRKRYYPGSQYVDIVGIDVYPSEYIGIGKPQDDTYAASFAAIAQVAPGKMVALAECEAIPNPDKLAKDGPQWLYCLPWWGIGKKHTAEWAKTTYTHEQFITLDQLPKWKQSP